MVFEYSERYLDDVDGSFIWPELYDECPNDFWDIALSIAKETVGTNEAFFPNKRTMETCWQIHAEAIIKAMHYAYYKIAKNDLPREGILCPIYKLAN